MKWFIFPTAQREVCTCWEDIDHGWSLRKSSLQTVMLSRFVQLRAERSCQLPRFTFNSRNRIRNYKNNHYLSSLIHLQVLLDSIWQLHSVIVEVRGAELRYSFNMVINHKSPCKHQAWSVLYCVDLCLDHHDQEISGHIPKLLSFSFLKTAYIRS